ncbi:hypothetical protein L1987_49404 [Smallanthus sonchifolius]|uniref:Uncharacterized protein n=1 Tax=Smallanthus sonchifolius TaxID=185202 RepID=A0ACB9FUF5_9ASTR|nr:hypothetical protein L1987_49404 [Smallanthus sonchifolius]
MIIHAGGIVERYYMAFPAAWIIDKYPKFVLTRPEIFRRPWDSVVRPEEMLVPGQKYFVVPILTVKKLRRRMLKSTTETSDSKPKHKPANRRVRFTGVAEDKEKKKKSSNGKGLRKKNVSFSPSLTIIDEP